MFNHPPRTLEEALATAFLKPRGASAPTAASLAATGGGAPAREKAATSSRPSATSTGAPSTDARRAPDPSTRLRARG